jgi:integrase
MTKTYKAYYLSETTCKKLAAPPRSATGKSNNVLYWDSKCDGLALRVTSTNIRRFVVSYQIHGNERRITLKPDFPYLSPTAARKEAIAIRLDASNGIDRLAEIEEARQAPTVEDWCKEYLGWAKEAKRPASLREDKRHAGYITAHFSKHKKFRDISMDEIERLQRRYKDKPRTANKILSLLSHMFTRARKLKLAGVAGNPVFGIERYKENQRTRAMDSEEAKRFIQAIDKWIVEIKADMKAPEDKRHEKRLIRQLTELRLFQFLLLTGARIGETCKAKWTDIDFRRLHGAVWTLPAHTTKTDKDLQLDLGPTAEAVLKDWRKEPQQCESELIFPGPGEGKLLTYPQHTWKGLKERAKIEDFRLHDLRHTNATTMLERGVSAYVIQNRLGHTSLRTTEKYLNPKAREPMREAAKTMGEHFQAMQSNETAKVTKLHTGGKK